MLFVLSKVVGVLLQPLVWLVGLLAWARFTRREGLRRRLLTVVLVLALLGTNPLLINWVLRAWEVPPIRVDSITEPYDVGIVLGGFSDSASDLQDRLVMNRSANRLTQGLELYHQGKVKKLLITGGSAAIIGRRRSEGQAVAQFLRRIRFPEEDLLIEGKSRNTHENAILTAAMLSEIGLSDARCLLLTDGFHMRRAMANFERVGLAVDAFSTSAAHRPFGLAAPQKWLIPDPRALEQWGQLLKEWVGGVVGR